MNIIFIALVSFVVLQRLSELIIAKRNEDWMKKNGAIEYGKDHYPFIVLVHIMFFISLILEVQFYEKQLSFIWPAILAIFIAVQALRVWSITSLGRFWNTKILILPNVCVISKGPYKFLRHPNYLVVAIEIFIIPLFFNAFLTAFVFSLLNTIIMLIRIPAEEKALMKETNYKGAFQYKSRFTPQKTTR